MQENNLKSLQKLGKSIKTLREKRKWKLETLSYRVGVSPSTIFRIETGKSEPKYLTLKNIANAFNLSLSEFFNTIK